MKQQLKCLQCDHIFDAYQDWTPRLACPHCGSGDAGALSPQEQILEALLAFPDAAWGGNNQPQAEAVARFLAGIDALESVCMPAPNVLHLKFSAALPPSEIVMLHRVTLSAHFVELEAADTISLHWE